MAAKKKAKAKKSRKKAQAKKVQPRNVSLKSAKKKSIKKKAIKKVQRKATAKSSAKAKTRTAAKVTSRRETPDSVFTEAPRRKAQLSDADMQGLSTTERADSESVEELLEEGNAFEAGVVEGVEQADNADEREVTTHEFPEDDVPGEYLEKDE